MPALLTEPVIVELVMTMKFVVWPAGFVTVATVWFVIVCPAFAGAASSSAASEVVARSVGREAGTRPRMKSREPFGIE